MRVYLVREGRVSRGDADDRDVVEATGVGDCCRGQVSCQRVRYDYRIHLQISIQNSV